METRNWLNSCRIRQIQDAKRPEQLPRRRRLGINSRNLGAAASELRRSWRRVAIRTGGSMSGVGRNARQESNARARLGLGWPHPGVAVAMASAVQTALPGSRGGSVLRRSSAETDLADSSAASARASAEPGASELRRSWRPAGSRTDARCPERSEMRGRKAMPPPGRSFLGVAVAVAFASAVEPALPGSRGGSVLRRSSAETALADGSAASARASAEPGASELRRSWRRAVSWTDARCLERGGIRGKKAMPAPGRSFPGVAVAIGSAVEPALP